MAGNAAKRTGEPRVNEATPPTESKAANAEEAEQQPGTRTTDDDATRHDTNRSKELSEGLAKIELNDPQSSDESLSRCVSPLEDDDYQSPIEIPEELDDDDFDFDSDMDGPVESSEDEETRTQRKNEILADDPWNALCVLGLRVYTLNSETTVCVIKSEKGS